jgi:hypothetical protein
MKKIISSPVNNIKIDFPTAIQFNLITEELKKTVLGFDSAKPIIPLNWKIYTLEIDNLPKLTAKALSQVLLAKGPFEKNQFSEHFASLTSDISDKKILETIAKRLAKNVLELSKNEIPHNLLYTAEHLKLALEKIIKCKKIIQNDPESPNQSKEEQMLKLTECLNKIAFENLAQIIASREPIITPYGEYIISEEITLEGHLGSCIKGYVFEPLETKEAFLIFRGTDLDSKKDTFGNILSDIGPLGAGGFEVLSTIFPKNEVKKFEKMTKKNDFSFIPEITEKLKNLKTDNSLALQETLAKLKAKGYKTIASGYSLGGATAVLTYLLYPSLIDKVIPRSAPGLSPVFSEITKKLMTNNANLNPKNITYYNNWGDPISGYQAKFGQTYLVSSNNQLYKNFKRYNQEKLTMSQFLTLLRPVIKTDFAIHSLEQLLEKTAFVYDYNFSPVPQKRQNFLNSDNVNNLLQFFRARFV